MAVTSSSQFHPTPSVMKQTIGSQGRSTVLVTVNQGNESKSTTLEPICECSILDGLQEMSGGVYEDPQNQSVGERSWVYLSGSRSYVIGSCILTINRLTSLCCHFITIFIFICFHSTCL